MTRQNSAYLTYILMIPAREFIKITICFLQGFEKNRQVSFSGLQILSQP